MEAQWQAARLFPITGIGGPAEEERRGTSVLLSVIQGVPGFGRAITSPMGAPSGRIETFIECEFQLGPKKCRPDGLICVTGNKKRVWTALVEVKTRKANLRAAQVQDYLDVAAVEGYDAVITVSSQIAPFPGMHPLDIEPKSHKKVPLHHLSWSEIHTEAIVEHNRHLVSDLDQAWILDEFLRYLESEKSGAFDFADMGASWVRTLKAAAQNNLKADDSGVAEIVARFAQLVWFAGMKQSQRLDVSVRPAISRRKQEDPTTQLELAKSGTLSGGLTVPGAVNPLRIVADIKSMRVECSVTINSPKAGLATSRVKWLTKQLHDPPSDLLVQATTAWSRSPGPKRRFDNVVDNPTVLVTDAKSDIRSFTLSVNRPTGTKRGIGNGSFIGSVLKTVDEFYERIVQNLKPENPKAPQVKVKPPEKSEPPKAAGGGAAPVIDVDSSNNGTVGQRAISRSIP